MSGRSEYTVDPEPIPPTPEPEQRAVEIPPQEWVSRAGWAQLGNHARKLGWRVRLTYARGWPDHKSDLKHSLLLRILDHENQTVAVAYWWALVSEEDTNNLAPAKGYAFKGALIRGDLIKYGSKDLKAWLVGHAPANPVP